MTVGGGRSAQDTPRERTRPPRCSWGRFYQRLDGETTGVGHAVRDSYSCTLGGRPCPSTDVRGELQEQSVAIGILKKFAFDGTREVT